MFMPGASTPTILSLMRDDTDAQFVAGADTLQQALARAMGQVSRASDCVFAVIQAREAPVAQTSDLTLLKLDAVVDAARVQIDAGVVWKGTFAPGRACVT